MKVTERSVNNINYERTPKQKSSLPAPDGGWGWVVVFSSLLCNILVDGIAFSFGVLLPKFAEHFEEPKSKVSLAGSLMIGMYLCSGPIAGGLVNKYGCRKVTMIGSIISAAGVLVGSFSTTLEGLILSYGVIGGIGFGMMYLPSIVTVGLYFDKKRPIATGIAVCGSGIGTFIFSPVIEYLSEKYNWRGTLLIMAGIILNGIICGMLFRPLTQTPKQRDPKSNGKHYSNTNLSAVKNGCEQILLEELQPFIENHQDTNDSKVLLPNSSRQSVSLNDIRKNQHISSHAEQPIQIPKQNIAEGEIVFISKFRSLPNLTYPKSNIQPETNHNKSCMQRCTPEEVCEMIDFTLLVNPSFVLVCIGNIFAGSGYAITLMYIVDRALLLRISGTKAAFLLSIIGIMNIFGRVLSGLMANIKNVNALLIHNIALLAVSIAVFLQPLCTIYPLLVVFAVIFGLCIAAHASLSSIILCDLLGVKRLATAFGLLGLARGISSVLGPLFAGMMFQATGNYDASFFLGGGMFLLGTIFHFMIFIPRFRGHSEKQLEVQLTI